MRDYIGPIIFALAYFGAMLMVGIVLGGALR